MFTTRVFHSFGNCFSSSPPLNIQLMRLHQTHRQSFISSATTCLFRLPRVCLLNYSPIIILIVSIVPTKRETETTWLRKQLNRQTPRRLRHSHKSRKGLKDRKRENQPIPGNFHNSFYSCLPNVDNLLGLLAFCYACLSPPVVIILRDQNLLSRARFY